MNPNNLTPDELVNYAAGIDVGPVAQPWIDALADALASAMDEIKQLGTDLKSSEDAADEARGAEESALDEANEWEEKYLEKCVEIDSLKEVIDAINLDKDGSGFVCEEMMDAVREAQSKT